MPTWKCLDCEKVQTDQELQCSCGNIDPCGFVEVDIYNTSEKERAKIKEEPKTMVEETPHVELKAEEEKPVSEEERAKIKRDGIIKRLKRKKGKGVGWGKG